MSGLFANFTVNNATALVVNSTGNSLELTLAQQRVMGCAKVVVTAPSSLVGGFILLEQQMEDGTWFGTPQEICVTASGGGTPNVIHDNTATATAVVGGRVKNTTGITTITSTLTAFFIYASYGRPQRIRWGATSGTAVLAIEEQGLTAV